MNTFYCDECGRTYSVDHSGMARHMGEDGETDYDADEDHVAYGEEPVIDTPNSVIERSSPGA